MLAERGVDALIQRMGTRFALILTGVYVPNFDGVKLLESCARKRSTHISKKTDQEGLVPITIKKILGQ